MVERADIKMAIDLADQLDDTQDSFRITSVLMDCGNEITKLRAELEAAKAERDPMYGRYSRHVEQLHGQIALLREALSALLTHMGMDEDEWNKVTFDQAQEALAATEQKE